MKRIALVMAFAAAALPAPAFADSIFDGTWKMDVGSAHMPTKPDQYLLKDGMYECTTCVPAEKLKADGTDQPVAHHPYVDTIAAKVVDDHTLQLTGKKSGKVVMASTMTVAANGKTATWQFNDGTASSGTIVKGTAMMTRVTAGPKGSHAVSGSWRTKSYAQVSDNGLAVTYKLAGDTLSMSNPVGQSYSAKTDGSDSPYSGDPGTTSVSVKIAGKRTIVETDKRNGKIIGVMHATVLADNKTMKISIEDKVHGTTMSFKAVKQ